MGVTSKIIMSMTLSLSFVLNTGCSLHSPEYKLSQSFKEKITTRQDYKLILISDHLPLKKQIKESLEEYSWEVVETQLDTSDIEWNKQYLGMPKYVLDIKKEKIFSKEDYDMYYYSIYLYDTQTNKNVLEINNTGTELKLISDINKFINEVK